MCTACREDDYACQALFWSGRSCCLGQNLILNGRMSYASAVPRQAFPSHRSDRCLITVQKEGPQDVHISFSCHARTIGIFRPLWYVDALRVPDSTSQIQRRRWSGTGSLYAVSLLGRWPSLVIVFALAALEDVIMVLLQSSLRT